MYFGRVSLCITCYGRALYEYTYQRRVPKIHRIRVARWCSAKQMNEVAEEATGGSTIKVLETAYMDIHGKPDER